jgi:hypothetical protein
MALVATCAIVGGCRDGERSASTTSAPPGTVAVTPRPECTDRRAVEDPLELTSSASAGGTAFVDVTCPAGIELDATPVSPPDRCIVGPDALTRSFPNDAAAFAELDTKYGGFCQWERFAGGVAVGDVNGDDRPDLYVPRLTEAGRLFVNAGNGRFDDVTAGSGLDRLDAAGVGAAFADIDNDGDDDLAVSALGAAQYYLFVNDGSGTFVEEAGARGVGDRTGQVHLGFSIAAGDYDLDGFVDLYFTQYSARPDDFPFPRARSALFHNLGPDRPGQFRDVTRAAGVQTADTDGTWTFAATIRDLDADGWPDLAVTRDFGTSALFWNNGDGTFTDGSADSAATTDGNGMGATTVDLDGDGLVDRVVTSIFDARGSSLTKGGNWGGTGNRVYRNLGDRRFDDVTDAYGLRDGQWGWGVAAIDTRNRGQFDLVQTSGIDAPDLDLLAPFLVAPTRVWQRQGDRYVDVAAASGLTVNNGRGLAVVDYDSDGRLDVIVVRPGSAPVLYRNVSEVGHWLRVVANGTSSNRDGLHALVTVDRGDGSEPVTQEIQSVSDFLGQSERVAHFGLGDNIDRVASVTVTFPTGITVVREDVAVDQLLEIIEPTSVQVTR